MPRPPVELELAANPEPAPFDETEEDAAEAAAPPEEPAAPELDLSAPEVADRLRAGTEIIERFVKTLPNAPGVYRMFDATGDVLYVGKARSLKKRVGQYALGRAHTARLTRMIAETAAMEFVTTATETEALLLEANLIKQLKPRYNVLLRDDMQGAIDGLEELK